MSIRRGFFVAGLCTLAALGACQPRGNAGEPAPGARGTPATARGGGPSVSQSRPGEGTSARNITHSQGSNLGLGGTDYNAAQQPTQIRTGGAGTSGGVFDGKGGFGSLGTGR